MNECMKKIKTKTKAGIATILAVIMVLVVLPWEALLAGASNTGGFELSLSWNDNDNDNDNDSDPDTYVYDSDKSESRVVRLKVKYANKDMKESYDPGTVIITVPGLRNAGRSEDITASSIAADKTTSTKKEYAWSYSYNASTDLYTFTNNNYLSAGTSFAGSFELLFTIASRTSKDAYKQELQADLYAKNGVEVQSNLLSYEQVRTKDTYTLDMGVGRRSYQGEEGVDSTMDPDDYWWVDYQVVSTRDTKSLGLTSSYYELLIPDGAQLRYVERGTNTTSLSSVIWEETGQTEVIDGITYRIYEVEVNAHSYANYILNFLVIYPKDTFDNSELVEVYARLHGTYEEEDAAERLAEEKTSTYVNDYPYPTYNGEILDGNKTGIGIGSGTAFAREYNQESYTNGYIDSRHISNGEVEYRYSLYGYVNYAALRRWEASAYDAFDFEIVDDTVEVLVDDGATYRALEDDEYSITSVTIPANSSILNHNNLAIEPCDVVISVLEAGATNYEELPGSYAVTASSQKITLPEDTVGVKLLFEGLEEGIEVTVPITMVFHSDRDDIVLNGGEVQNTTVLRAYSYYTSAAAGQQELFQAETSAKKSTEDITSAEQDTTGEAEKPDSSDENTTDEEEAEPISELTGEEADETEEAESISDEADSPPDTSAAAQENITASGQAESQAESQTGSESSSLTETKSSSGTLIDPASDKTYYGMTSGPYIAPFRLYVLERPNFFYNTTLLTAFNEYSFSQGGLPATMSLRTTFSYLEDEDLQNFSMYTILPEEMTLDNAVRSVYDLYDAVTISNSLGLSSSALEKALTITMDTNYRGSGRTMLRFQFSLDQAVTEPSGYITVGFPVVAGSYDIFRYGISTTVRGVSIVEDEDIIARPSYGIGTNDGTYAGSSERDLWADLGEDGQSDSAVSYSTASRSKSTLAVAIEEGITKRVATKTSGNVYTRSSLDDADDVLLAERGSSYSYMLQMNPMEDNNGSYVTDIVLMDVLESADRSEWQGTIDYVDASVAEQILSVESEREIEAEILYSAKDYSTEMKASNTYEPDLATSDWVPAEDWDDDKLDEVRSVAIDFGDAILKGEQQLSVTIHMTAPEDQAYTGTYTENESGVWYRGMDSSGIETDTYWLPSNQVAVRLTEKLVTLTLEKVDAEDGSVLSGAVFDLYYAEDGNEPDYDNENPIRTGLTTNAKGQINVQRLEEGIYYLVETAAPDGYVLNSDPIELKVYAEDSGNTVTIQIENERKPGSVTLQKTNDMSETIFPEGAEFELYWYNEETDTYELYDPNETGSNTYTTDAKGQITISDLPWGAYYFIEVSAPDGYAEADADVRYEFTIAAGSGTEAAITVTAENEQIPAAVQLIKYERLENGDTTTTVVPEAFYTLYTADGTDLGTYRTDSQGKTAVIEDLAFGNYYFKESVTPNGYYTYGEGDGDDSSGEIPFELKAGDTNDDPLIVETYDQRKYGELWVQKTDDAGSYVKGAEYTLYLLDDNGSYDENAPYEAYTGYENPAVTDSEGAMTFDKLVWGTYILKETTAPQGYELDETEHVIEIGPDTVSSTYVLQVSDERKTGSIQIIKIREDGDPDDPTDRLAGAVFSLYRNDGTLVSEGHTTNSDGEVLIEDLEWGSYYLEETKAPNNYSLASAKIRFSINALNADIVQVIEVENPTQRAQLSLTKRIYLEDWVDSHGNPTFLFKVVNEKGDTWHKTVVFDEDLRTNGNTGTDSKGEYIELTTILADLDAGTYTVSEEDVIRYEASEIIVTSTGSNTFPSYGRSMRIVPQQRSQRTPEIRQLLISLNR